MSRARTVTAVAAACGVFATAGVAAANFGFSVGGGSGGGARLSCPGGMSRLGHIFDENATVFPGDPAPHIEIVADVANDGYLVELVETGTHTGTHLDAPGHFIEGGRTVDELDATEFVWPAYVIDVRDRMANEDDDDFQLTVDDVRAYERANGRIRRGAMVIIQTGFDAFYGTDAFLGDAPGFSGAAVQWMVDRRDIGGIGSDTFGPDATSDDLFDATYTILLNDKVALPGINDVDSLSIRGDLIIANAIPLRDGSGFETDPLACHGSNRDR